MKKFSLHMFLSAVGLAAALNIGCSSGTKDPGAGIPLMPSTDGFFDGSNEAGILGAWYSYGDWYGGMPATGGMGDCKVKGGFDQAVCSVIETPIPGEKFTNTGKMCTKGTAAKVVNDSTGMFAYSAIWGAGIGFDMANAGTDDGGTGEKGTWDATAHNVVGFSFHIDMPPVGGQMRVEFPTYAIKGTTDINSAYWGGATMGLSPFKTAGDYSFMFDDVPAGSGVGGPMYLMAAATPFDRTKIVSMQFHVVTNTSSPVPFDYC